MKRHIKFISAILLTAALSACGGNAPDVPEIEETEIEETEIEETDIEEDDDIDEDEEDETDFQTTEAEEEPDNTQSNGEYEYIVDGDHIRLTNYLGKYLGNEAEEVTIPSDIDGVKVTIIGDETFQGCENIKKIVIPNSVVQIEGLAFAGCKSLTDINIPEAISTIESVTFDNCESLTEITIPNSVTKIETWAFLGCTGLKKIVIPDNVTEIESGAFQGCTSLSDVTLPEHFNNEDDIYLAFGDTPWYEKNYGEYGE